MSSFHALNVECRAAAVDPPTALAHLGHLRAYADDAFVYGGTLVFRVGKGNPDEDVEAALLELHREAPGIERAAMQWTNDTSCTSTVRFGRLSRSGFQAMETIRTGQGYERPATWGSVLPAAFDVQEARERRRQDGVGSDELYRYYEQPFVYLQDRYGFHGLSVWEIIYDSDGLNRCPPPSIDPDVVTDVTYQILLPFRETASHDDDLTERIDVAAESVEDLSVTCVDLAPEYVQVRVSASPVEPPRRTIDRVRRLVQSSMLEGDSNSPTDTDVRLDRGYLFRTESLPESAVDHFLGPDGETEDPWPNHTILRYHVGLEYAEPPDVDPTTIAIAVRKGMADRPVRVYAVEPKPGGVLVTVQATLTDTPWVIARWLRWAIADHGTPERDPPSWRPDFHVSTSTAGRERIARRLSN